MPDFRQEFLEFALARDVLRFGAFVTKAGRKTPYFFNAGLFNDGASLGELGRYYATAYLASEVRCDQLYGPAYKGITLAAVTAVALAAKGHNLPYSFNRKEAKDHGEGGAIVGAALKGRVLIVDDVITDGGAKREAIDLIRAHGATPAGGADRLRSDGTRPRRALGGAGVGTGIRHPGHSDRDARRLAGVAGGAPGPGAAKARSDLVSRAIWRRRVRRREPPETGKGLL